MTGHSRPLPLQYSTAYGSNNASNASNTDSVFTLPPPGYDEYVEALPTDLKDLTNEKEPWTDTDVPSARNSSGTPVPSFDRTAFKARPGDVPPDIEDDFIRLYGLPSSSTRDQSLQSQTSETPATHKGLDPHAARKVEEWGNARRG
jgi:hypothetical protein